jgi:hypothetical protein
MDVKGKGRLAEIDYDAAFAAFDREQAQSRARIVEVDPMTSLEEAFAGQALEDRQDDMPHLEDYQRYLNTCSWVLCELTRSSYRVWGEMQEAGTPAHLKSAVDPSWGDMADMAKFEADFSQMMASEREDLDYGEGIAEYWRHQTAHGEDFLGKGMEGTSGQNFVEGLPVFEDYEFGVSPLSSHNI